MIKDNQFYKILVVEDNLGDFVLVEEYISECFLHTQIINARSYSEFEHFIKTKVHFDIIFLDLTLPDRYGKKLIISCLELVNLIPIVVLTGYQDFNFAKESLNLGISDYLLKEDINSPTLYKCIIYNIERHKNYKKIKESEQQYQKLFQLSPTPLFLFDKKSRKIVDVNESALKKYKYTLEEFLEKKIEDLSTEDKLFHELDEKFILTNEKAKSILDKIIIHKKKNNKLLYVICSQNKITYKGIESVILSIEDLTNEIRQIQSIQLQNNKLRKIAWFQSHFVRAPLARIMGLISIFNFKNLSTVEHQNILSLISKSAEDLDSIIRKIVKETKEI